LLHAAGESSPGNIQEGTYALALAADDEFDLLRIEQALIDCGTRFRSIREPDPPYLNSLMAIGLEPMPKRSLPKFLKKLRLLQ